MEAMLTVQEAMSYLRESEIDHSEQMIRRWLRQGKIKGVRSANRKEGWRIPADEIWHLIEAPQWKGTPYEDGIDENTIIRRFQEEIEELQKLIRELSNENYEYRVKLGLEDDMPF